MCGEADASRYVIESSPFFFFHQDFAMLYTVALLDIHLDVVRVVVAKFGR